MIDKMEKIKKKNSYEKDLESLIKSFENFQNTNVKL